MDRFLKTSKSPLVGPSVNKINIRTKMYEQVNQENLVVYYEYLIAQKKEEIKNSDLNGALSGMKIYSQLEMQEK